MLAATTDLAVGLPQRIAEAFARTGALQLLDIDLSSLQLRMQLIWHERTHHDSGARAFRHIVESAFSAGLDRREKATPRAGGRSRWPRRSPSLESE